MKPRRVPYQFRFQIITQWILDAYHPQRVADISGGKGLLTYFLQKNGWNATVIDPRPQLLPLVYTDITLKKHIPISSREKVQRIDLPFQEEMAQSFDLLVGIYAHGANIKILHAAARYNKDVLLLPCCAIDEPIGRDPHRTWFDVLEEYALNLKLSVQKIQFPIARQRNALYTSRRYSSF